MSVRRDEFESHHSRDDQSDADEAQDFTRFTKAKHSDQRRADRANC